MTGMATVTRLEETDWRRWRAVRLRALQNAPEAFASTYEGTLRRDSEQYWRRYFSMSGPCFVATGEPPGGMVRLLAPTRTDEPAEIISMWVAPERRRDGVGSALIRECIEWLADHHPTARIRLAVKEANDPARALYERCGFEFIGRNPQDDSELLMERGPHPAGTGPEATPR